MQQSNEYELLAESWARRFDKPFDYTGHEYVLCMQLIDALFNVGNETLEFIEGDPAAFADRVAVYRCALHCGE